MDMGMGTWIPQFGVNLQKNLRKMGVCDTYIPFQKFTILGVLKEFV